MGAAKETNSESGKRSRFGTSDGSVSSGDSSGDDAPCLRTWCEGGVKDGAVEIEKGVLSHQVCFCISLT